MAVLSLEKGLAVSYGLHSFGFRNNQKLIRVYFLLPIQYLKCFHMVFYEEKKKSYTNSDIQIFHSKLPLWCF